MKKNRYIPYGYSVRNGHTVIEHNEAEVIRRIFSSYINGASLQEIADLLTEERIPYTEKTTQWDKARIARIIDNSRYTGTQEYDPIIDLDTYEVAATVKIVRQRSRSKPESYEIALLRDRVRCAECGSPMLHHAISSRSKTESWSCGNDACGIRVKISDSDLLQKTRIVMNRIICNADLLIPRPRIRHNDSHQVALLQAEVDQEMQREHPSEELVVSLIGEMASQIYRESDSKEMITARILQKKIQSLQPLDAFDGSAFSLIVENVILGRDGSVALKTKTEEIVGEGGIDNGSPENS